MKKLCWAFILVLVLQTSAFAQTLEWTSGQLGGGWYTMTSGLAKFIEESNPDLKIKVVPGGGTANPTKVEKGKSQLGLGLDVLAYLAGQGKDMYSGKPHTNLLMIGSSLSDTIFHVVRAQDAKYSFEELFTTATDARIAVTKVGSSDEKIFSWLMAYYGTSYEKMKKRGVRINHGNYSEISSQFKDKLVDYVFINLGLPASAVIDMLISRKGDLFSLPEPVLKSFNEQYGYVSSMIKAGTYKGQDQDIVTGNMRTVILVNKSVPEEIVYKLARTICENESRLGDIHKSMEAYKCATALKDPSLPAHPGAVRYYKEKGYIQ